MKSDNNIYLCTCKKGSIAHYESNHHKFEITLVDEDEACIYCGHYAHVRNKNNLDMNLDGMITKAEQGKLYNKNYDHIQAVSNGLFEHTLIGVLND